MHHQVHISKDKTKMLENSNAIPRDSGYRYIDEVTQEKKVEFHVDVSDELQDSVMNDMGENLSICLPTNSSKPLIIFRHMSVSLSNSV